jgi:hypothetical protein
MRRTAGAKFLSHANRAASRALRVATPQTSRSESKEPLSSGTTLREKGEEATFASHLHVSGVRRQLNGIDGLARQAIRGARNLHGADEVKLLDRRDNNHGNSAAFEEVFVLAVTL